MKTCASIELGEVEGANYTRVVASILGPGIFLIIFQKHSESFRKNVFCWCQGVKCMKIKQYDDIENSTSISTGDRESGD